MPPPRTAYTCRRSWREYRGRQPPGARGPRRRSL